MRTSKPTLGVVGATGAVGQAVLDILRLREDVWESVRLSAAPDDVGQRLRVCGQDVEIERLTPDFFGGIDIALFDLPPHMARMWAPRAVDAGAVVIDNSIDFRREADVPLVAASVNLEQVRSRPRGIVANPGATALTIVDALGVLHEAYGLKSLVLTTFQAASGVGRRGVTRLYDEIALVAGDRTAGQMSGDVRRLVEHELGPSPFPAPLALNVIPFVGTAQERGGTSEEAKVRDELRKILGLKDLPIAVTCVRVPVVTAHSVSVHAGFSSRVTPDSAREVLTLSPNVVVLDDLEHQEFPTPGDSVGSDPRFVGRIRTAPGFRNTLDFFICGDNLRGGGAGNLVELAERIAAER